MPQLRGQTRRQTRSQTRAQALPYRPPQPRTMEGENSITPPLPAYTQRPAIAPLTTSPTISSTPPAFAGPMPQAPDSADILIRPTVADVLTIDFGHPAARRIPTAHLEGLAEVLGWDIINLQQQRDQVQEELTKHHTCREKAKQRIADLEAVANEIGWSPSLTRELAEAQAEATAQQGELEPLAWSLIHIDDHEMERLQVYDRVEYEIRRRQLFSNVFGAVYSSGET